MRANKPVVGANAPRMQKPVWVDLRMAFPAGSDTPPPRWNQQTINLTEESAGILSGWQRSSTGEWFGVVSFTVMYSDLNPSTGLELTDQLVPAEALRPRVYGAARRA
jgi:hypothetical protein